MQLYVDFYSQLHYSTCFGRHAPIIRSIKRSIVQTKCITFNYDCGCWKINFVRRKKKPVYDRELFLIVFILFVIVQGEHKNTP